jgi:geranylgeranyl pyrophosphate synthase
MAPSISPTYSPDRIDELLAPARRCVEDALERFCRVHLQDGYGGLAPVVQYSLLGGGKRFRGVLVCAAYEAVAANASFDKAADLAASVETVHAYSLIHDDLPCMDDDDIRRGRPSSHRQFDVSSATAAGLLMVPLAAKSAMLAARELGLNNHEGAAIVRELMIAAGGGGMIAGQLLDLEGEGKALPREQLEAIHRAKTGALITASAGVGAMAARADASLLAALRKYGELVGLAFQIADDLLDVTASTAVLGKTAGRDQALGKSTYPALLGVENAWKLARQYADEAATTIHSAGLHTPLLGALSSYVVARRS